MIDWGFATKIGVTGLLTVFVVLGILSLILWLSSYVLRKMAQRKKQKTPKPANDPAGQ